jgi:hypothetical protein
MPILFVVSDFCCEEHVYASSHVKEECLFYLNQFLDFVIMNVVED